MAAAHCPFYATSPNRSAAAAVWAKPGAGVASFAHPSVQVSASCLSFSSIFFFFFAFVLSVRLFATPWIVARQASLFVEFPRQEYWSGLPFPTPGAFPDPGIELGSLVSPSLVKWIFYHFGHLGSLPFFQFSSVHFSSVAQSCPTLCDPMDCSIPGLPVHHQLPKFTQTHVH